MTGAEQRTLAKARANESRTAKARDREHIRRGRLKVSDIIEDPAEHWHSTLVYELLLMAPWFGRKRLREFNARATWAGLNVCSSVGELGQLERYFAAEYLRERGL